MEIDKIYLGDCLELMKEIPDKSIDCIVPMYLIVLLQEVMLVIVVE